MSKLLLRAPIRRRIASSTRTPPTLWRLRSGHAGRPMTLPGTTFCPPHTLFLMKAGHVPLVPDHRPDDPAADDRVAHRIAHMQLAGTPIRAVMLARMGLNVWHRSPAEASAVLEELEESARL